MIKEPDNELNQLANQVIGLAIEVHRGLGPGYIESIYEHALCKELEMHGIPYISQYPIEVTYKGSSVGEGRLDILIDRRLIVEIKAVAQLLPVHYAQLKSYLKAMRLPLGLLINFNEEKVSSGIRRLVYTKD